MPRRLAPPHLLLAAYSAGLCASLAVRPAAWALVLAAAALAAAFAVVPRAVVAPGSRRLPVLLAAGVAGLFLLAGVTVGEQRLGALQRSALRPLAGHTVSLRAVLTDLPAVDGEQVTLAVLVTAVGGRSVREPAHLRLRLGPGQSFALDSCGPLVEGACLLVDPVRVATLPEARPGSFDYGRYLRRRGEHVTLEARFADLRIVGRRGGAAGLVDRLRVASRAHLRVGVHPPVSEVLQGMVLGDDEGVDGQSIEDFRRSGLLHIMAVSGENVVLLCGMWTFALALLAVPRLARTLLLLPLVATYVLLTGASPSIVRAGVAGIVGLLAVLASRPSDGWLLWLAPAAWLLTVNPNTLYDVSFQLAARLAGRVRQGRGFCL